MLNAIMLTHNRPLLTKQALSTFFKHSKLDWTLVVVDDDSHYQTQTILNNYNIRPQMKIVRVENSIHNTAMLRNLGVYFSEHYFGRGDYLYLSDNDAYFTVGWDAELVSALELADTQIGLRLLGPYRHPYHQPNKDALVGISHIAITDAVQGIGHLMKWDTWDRYGPLVEHKGDGLGTNQSEDFAFCQKIVKDGYLVGSVQPNVVWNCGLTGSNGKKSPGYELIERIKGVYYE